jgi:hypothetical protein
MRSTRAAAWIGLLATVVLGAPPVVADVCQVPSGSYPTIQAAVDAPVCTEIDVAAGAFAESVVIPRDLVLRGVSAATTVIEGRVTVQGASTVVSLEDLTVDGSAPGVAGSFAEALLAEGGAEVSGSNIVVLNAAIDLATIFADGFESGDATAWTRTQP